jgi:putative hydrolase of the HAD superfamily
MEQKIKWILFDLSGVVVKWIFVNPDGYTVNSRFFNVETFADLFFTKDHHEYCLGHLSHEQLVERFIKRKKLDLSVDEYNELVKNDVTPNVGMLPLIEALSKKYKIAIATNEGTLHTKYKIEGSGVMPYLSKIIASYRIHEVKPDTAFYKRTLEMIEAKPEECIFIDDKQENVDAANSIGMKGILFTDVLQLQKDLHALQLQ